MATLKLVGFSGEIPKLVPHLLPDMSAQAAFNVRLDDGALTAIRKPRRVYGFSPGSNYRTIYRHNEEWLAWTTDVDAAPGPVADDRLYFTGDGVPKVRINGNTYPLAVPAPTEKLVATASGTGDGDIVTRLYAYTFVTEFGEESEPSPISNEVDWKPGQTVELSGFHAAPPGRGITKQRIYRSQTGASGLTDLYFIAERNASASDFVDNIPPNEIGEPLPSRLWNPPPDNLRGLTALPNGMMAGFVGKDLYFCEPYRPHAWPENYVMTFDYEIVGLGAFGTSLVVATKGHPYIVSGTAPENMIQEKLEQNLPCISPRSIVDLGYAVAYASHEGLVVVSSNGAQLASTSLISRDQWLQYSPRTFVCGQFQSRYYASYRYYDDDLIEHTGTLIIDLSGELPFIARTGVSADVFFYSLKEGSLFYLQGDDIFEFDAPGQPRELMRWRSKKFILPKPVNFGAILVEAEDELTAKEREALEEEIERIRQDNAEKIANGLVYGAIGDAPIDIYAINDDALEELPPGAEETAVSIYADGRLVAVINRVNRMHRLPSGFLARQIEIEVSGSMRILQITLATTGAELMGV